jgi:hypothetical protein
MFSGDGKSRDHNATAQMDGVPIGVLVSRSLIESAERRAARAVTDIPGTLAGQSARYSVFFRKRFWAKALPEPDLKYRSRLRALASSATATYERRMTGRYLQVEATEPC